MTTAALVTRPERDGATTAAMLGELGWDPILCPMIRIDYRGETIDIGSYQALLLTSMNGARALAAATPRRDIRILAVGEATAGAAHAAGFAAVESADGDVHSLAGLVVDRLAPADGPLLHIAGSVQAGDLVGLVRSHGFTADRHVLYDAVPVARLPGEASAALDAGRVGLVVFYSPRTGATFARLLHEEGREATVATAHAGCLSQAVAQAIDPLPWRKIHVAARPTQASLLAEIAGLAPGTTGRGGPSER